MKIEQMPGTDISAQAVLGGALERAIEGELKDVVVVGFDKEGTAVLTYSTMKGSDLAYLKVAFDAMVARVLVGR